MLLDQNDKQQFKLLFDKLKNEFNIESTDELMGLERALKNYLKVLKAEDIIAKEGELIIRSRIDPKWIKNKNISEDTILKLIEASKFQAVNPLLRWIDVWETQFRSWMKEMRFTRKEKKQTEEKIKDLANQLSQ